MYKKLIEKIERLDTGYQPQAYLDALNDVLDILRSSVNVESNIYDECETHTGCTVQILRNSITGETSVGWWKPNDEYSTDEIC